MPLGLLGARDKAGLLSAGVSFWLRYLTLLTEVPYCVHTGRQYYWQLRMRLLRKCAFPGNGIICHSEGGTTAILTQRWLQLLLLLISSGRQTGTVVWCWSVALPRVARTT
jgi:hypothetical protein